jgi:hypothetical protein
LIKTIEPIFEDGGGEDYYSRIDLTANTPFGRLPLFDTAFETFLPIQRRSPTYQ